MLKKRLIFTLLLDDGNYMLSRNFSLQKVGDLHWIKENYDFDLISSAIDELVILNVERGEKNLKKFSENLIALTKTCFMPVAAGGGIQSMKDAELALNSGADKLIVNSILIEDHQLIKSLVKRYGTQCVVGSIDYKKVNEERVVFIHDGAKSTDLNVEDVVRIAEKLNVGEILLTSMDQDGTGMGFDMDFIRKISKSVKMPIIPAGGAGKYQHFVDVIEQCDICAVSTANLFNFMCDGIKDSREKMLKDRIDLAAWNTKL